MRRPSILGGLGALLVLVPACSGDTFSSAAGSKKDGGNGANQASSGGNAGTTGSSGNGGNAGTKGGSPGSGGTAGQVGAGGAMADASASTGGIRGIEAGVAEAGGLQTWCDGKNSVLLCEDFDKYADVNDLFNAWGNYSVIGGQFSFSTGGGIPTRPNALRVVTTSTSNVKTLISKSIPAFATLPSKLHLEFTLRIDKAENIGYLAGSGFAAILDGTEITDGVVAITIGQALIGGANVLGVAYIAPLSDGGSQIDSKTAQGPFPPTNQWIGRYALDIQYTTGATGRSGCARLLAAGTSLTDSCLSLPPSLSSPKAVSVVLGLYSAGANPNSGNLEIEFDDVTLAGG